MRDGVGQAPARGPLRSHARRPAATLASFAAILALVVLGGCQVRPLYAETGGRSGSDPLPEMAAVFIDEPETRVEQVFRNTLIFGLTGGAAPAAPRYRLGYRMTIEEEELGLEEITGTPRAYQVAGRISFILEDVSSGRPVMSDQATAIASFDRSSQNFANVRARRDAVDRLAKALAAQVETRLASYFATI